MTVYNLILDVSGVIKSLHKGTVQHCKVNDRKKHLEHPRVHRPWGWYEGIDQGESFQVKRIMIKPGENSPCRCITIVLNTGLWSAALPRPWSMAKKYCLLQTNPLISHSVTFIGWKTPEKSLSI
ncbi:hypothetical protein [Nitrosomonas communis]|uniref:hypothetical protein n=1 Tax=Nitrosomonas communis TaxID=44574 RepID=UPI003D2E5490